MLNKLTDGKITVMYVVCRAWTPGNTMSSMIMGGARSKLFIEQVTFSNGAPHILAPPSRIVVGRLGRGGGGGGEGEDNNKYSLVNDCVPRTKLY